MSKKVLMSLTVLFVGTVGLLQTVPAYAAPPKGHDFTVAAPDANYAPGELIVRFAPKADGEQRTTAEQNAVLSAINGGTVEESCKLVPGLTLVILPAGQTVKDALKTFNNTDGILYAEPNYECEVESTFPNEINSPGRFDELWGLHNTGQTGGTEDADIDAPEAWDIATDSNIIVAVIDSGVDYTHPDLADNMWVNEDEYYGEPGVDDDDNGYVDDIYGYDFCGYWGKLRDADPMDDEGHGTRCAGTIGAVGNNGEGVVGVCWNVKIMALKWVNAIRMGDVWDAVMCIDYAVDMGAKVLNNSWGGVSYYAGLETAIENAGVAGVLFVASAGNSGLDNDVNPRYPTCFDFDNIIAVMATDHDDKRWWESSSKSSNWGAASVDLAAPGSDILSCSLKGEYAYASGTSRAAPHVAGACALIWSANPDLTYRQVKNILLDTVDTIPELQNETPCVSGGRLNLNNALVEATRNLADFNRDEVVNFLDYALFADTWQTTPSDVNDYNDIFDLDDNDSIDYNDLDIFTDDWLWQAEKV